ncbi:MAG: hypothetical protein UW23_C0031G0015 [Candidatus Collierbacteria bacterium GW2011_GWA1_44_12]|uniref:Uncharacterized protein n=1 Tax=Candidatus Collierbacteria bacterium GW2011_GWA1_44_12 TaxID=1618376 RepID=A0A0G1GIC3_9BACT|nr:MAG: hypothetical protein UW23_C0031G0015 [Candidatus Collierbacteria bacterium GW2011_GWA1_44_12]
MKANDLVFRLVCFLFVSVLVFVPIVLATDTATVTATVTVQNISVSVSPGTVTYGTLANNASADTNPAATQTATNNGNVAEDFFIKGVNTADWTLAGTAGSDQYVHKFCVATCGTPPTNYTALTINDSALATAVATSGTQTFDLEITTPNPSTVYTEQSPNITVTATTVN